MLLAIALLGGRLALALDTGHVDLGSPRGGVPRAGVTDTGVGDTGWTDTGATDTGATDTGATDTGGSRDPVEPLSVTDAVSHWIGIAERDFVGEYVRIVGDVDGNGHDDIVVGMRGYDLTSAVINSGAVAIVYGRLGTAGETSLSTQGRWTGTLPNRGLGYAVSAAGDVNGDGYADFLASAPDDFAQRGRTWLVYGNPRPHRSSAAISNPSTASWRGVSAGVQSGYGLSAAGDVDGDGYDDFMIGSIGADSGDSIDAGAVHLIYGQADAYVGLHHLRDESAWWGEESGDELGGRYSISHGDIDGDGLEDLVMGAPMYGSDDAGAVYVWGGAHTRSTSDNYAGDSDSIVRGMTVGGDSRFGYGVSSNGDVDGDGYDDLAAGAYYYDEPHEQAGRGYLFYGGAGAPGLVTADDADLVIESTRGQARLGREVSIEGDIDGDGLHDFVLGMYRWREPLPLAGGVVVFMGDPDLSGSHDIGVADYQFEGDTTNGHFGYSLHTGGDVDGDGIDDLVVGSPGINTSQGEIHLFSSSLFSSR